MKYLLNSLAISSGSVVVELFKINLFDGALCNFFCSVSLITDQVYLMLFL